MSRQLPNEWRPPNWNSGVRDQFDLPEMNSEAVNVASRRNNMETNRLLSWCVKSRLPGLIPVLVWLLAWQLPITAATLTTDQPDYHPGQYVTFTGTGWQAGETVTIDVYETTIDPFYWEGRLSAIADASGKISNNSFIVQQSFLGQGFSANAA